MSNNQSVGHLKEEKRSEPIREPVVIYFLSGEKFMLIDLERLALITTQLTRVRVIFESHNTTAMTVALSSFFIVQFQLLMVSMSSDLLS